MSDIPPVSGKVGLDVTEFKAALSEMNRDIRVIESAFRATAASLGDWGSNIDGLEARIESLNEQIDIQKRKVEALKEQYEKVRAEKGENSRAAEELEIKLNREREALGKMQTELGTSEGKLDELKTSSEDAGKGMDDLERETNESKGALEKLQGVADGLKAGLAIGVAAIAGLAVAVVGVSTAITNLVLDAADAAGELGDMSLKTGLSTERLQELDYVAGQVGTSTDTMTGSLSKLVRSLDTAREQQQKFDEQLASGKHEDEITMTMDQAKAFNQLGVAFVDASGNLRDKNVVFGEVIDALGGIANETERDALAMALFGKSAMELNPLIKAGAAEIANLSKEAHEVGAVVSDESISALEEFGDELESLKAGLKGTMMELATAFLPGANALVDTAQTYLGQFGDIVRGADGDLVAMADGIGKLVGDIANEITTKGPEFLQAGLNIIQGILDAITDNLPALVEAATGIITMLMQFLTDNLPSLIRSGVQIILALVKAIIDNLPELVEAGIEALIALVEGISEALPELIPAITEAIILITEILLEHLPELVEAGGKLLIAIVKGLAAALPILIEKTPELVAALADALIALLPILAEVGLQMLNTVVKAIGDNLPLMGKAAGELIVVIQEKVKDLWETIKSVGKSMVEGIWQGMKDNAAWFLGQISGFFLKLIDSVLESLGIHSPSKVFAGIGENVGSSYIESLGAALEKGQRALKTAFGETALTLNAQPALASAPGAAAASAGQVVNNIFYLTANYPGQSSAGVAADIKMLQMLYG